MRSFSSLFSNTGSPFSILPWWLHGAQVEVEPLTFLAQYVCSPGLKGGLPTGGAGCSIRPADLDSYIRISYGGVLENAASPMKKKDEKKGVDPILSEIASEIGNNFSFRGFL